MDPVVKSVVGKLLAAELTARQWADVCEHYGRAKGVKIEPDEEELFDPGEPKTKTRKKTPVKTKVKLGNRGDLLARLEAAEEEKLPKTEWETAHVLAYFHRKYEKWCRAPYRVGTIASQLKEISYSVQEYGPDQVVLGIDALFGKPMDWCTGKSMAFLTDDTKWSRFVAPAIVELRRKRGSSEQSESKVERTESYTVRRK